MPNNEAMVLAEKMIRSELSTLDDLPYELANTIANIYYKFAIGFLDLERMQSGGGTFPESVTREVGTKPIDEIFTTFAISSARIIADKKAIAASVKGLRKIDRIRLPRDYQYTVELILDCTKYDIPDGHNKSRFRRILERRFRKTNEISNLLDLMNFSMPKSEHK